MVAREVTGAEKALWWQRAVEAFPPYAEYQRKTDREIPVFVLERALRHSSRCGHAGAGRPAAGQRSRHVRRHPPAPTVRACR